MSMRTLLFAAVTTASAAPLAAQQSLRDVGYVNEGLIAVGIAYEISQVCDDIGARTLRGLGYLINQLNNHAKDLGFSSAEIKEYTSNRAEKDRLEGIARQRLAAMGAQPGYAASHCAVGKAEIAKESTIGYLLR
jgi:hypothetical protein